MTKNKDYPGEKLSRVEQRRIWYHPPLYESRWWSILRYLYRSEYQITTSSGRRRVVYVERDEVCFDPKTEKRKH
jgi:hypothetical protein